MAKATVVSLELETGEKIIEALDESGLKPSVAFWATLSEYGDTRLILASRFFNEENQIKAYGKVFGALDSRGIANREIPPLLILSMRDRFIQELRKVFGKTQSVAGMRLGGQSFGDRFIEDGYVYRIT